MATELNKPTRVLLIEDNPIHTRMIKMMLIKGEYDSFTLKNVLTLKDGIESLSMDEFDIILLDLGLPDSQGLESFNRIHNQSPDTPIVVLTSNEDEDSAMEIVKGGAQDYLYKMEVSPGILIRSMRYALERKRAQKEQERLIGELKEALETVKTLSGLIPICANCKKIRDDEGYWQKLEKYISEHSNAIFTHGICPDCEKELYPRRKKDN